MIRSWVLVHGSDQLPFPYQLRQPGLDATNWRAELAIRFGVIPRSSDTNQILKFLLRFLVPRTKLLRRPVQTQSSWLARGRSPRAIASAQARAPKCSGQPRPLRCRSPEPRRSFCTAAESSRLEGEGWLTRGWQGERTWIRCFRPIGGGGNPHPSRRVCACI